MRPASSPSASWPEGPAPLASLANRPQILDVKAYRVLRHLMDRRWHGRTSALTPEQAAALHVPAPDGTGAVALTDLDRRLLPGEDANTAHAELVEYLRQRVPPHVRWECLPLRLSIPSLGSAGSEEITRRLGTAIDRVVNSHTVHTVPFGTDASTIAQAGIPAVIFGPGDIARAHTADESIELDQLAQASEILFQLAAAG